MMRYIKLGNYVAGKDIPDIRYRPSLPERVMEVLALLPVLALWGIVLAWRLRGVAVDGEWYTTGGLAVVCFVVLLVASHSRMGSIRFPFRITRGNAVRQYVLVLRLCRVLNIIIGCMLFLSPFKEAGCRWAGIGLVVTSVLLGLSLAGYYLLAWRQR